MRRKHFGVWLVFVAVGCVGSPDQPAPEAVGVTASSLTPSVDDGVTFSGSFAYNGVTIAYSGKQTGDYALRSSWNDPDETGLSWDTTNLTSLVGDFNNDGYDDLVQVCNTTTGCSPRIFLGGGTATGGAFKRLVYKATLPVAYDGINWSTTDYVFHVIDRDADGKKEILLQSKTASLPNRIYSLNATLNGFTRLSTWNNPDANGVYWNYDKHRLLNVDMNGDGKSDAFLQGVNRSDNDQILLGNGTGYAAPYYTHTNPGSGTDCDPDAQWNSTYGTTGGWSSYNRYPRFLADVNGDGKKDVVGFANSGVAVATSTGSGLNTYSTWIANYGPNNSWSDMDVYPRYVVDVNGDGKADVVGFGNTDVYVSLSNGTSFAAQDSWKSGFTVNNGNWASMSQNPRLMGDVNGDGKADIVAIGNNGVYTSLSTGSAFGGLAYLDDAFAYNGSAAVGGPYLSLDKNPRVLGDVNGDGKDDIIGFGVDGCYVSLSTGTNFAAATKWYAGYATSGGWASQSTHPRFVVDVNGDGKDDLVGFGSNDVYVSLSTGSGFAPAQIWVNDNLTLNFGYPSQDATPRSMVDVDKDGKADLVAFKSDGTVLVAYSTGTSFLPLVQMDSTSAYDSWDTNPRMLGDLTGDGRPEVVTFGAATMVGRKQNVCWNALENSIRLGDFDGDGLVDVFVQRGAKDRNSQFAYYRNTGTSFTNTKMFSSPYAGALWSTDVANTYIGKFDANNSRDILIQPKITGQIPRIVGWTGTDWTSKKSWSLVDANGVSWLSTDAQLNFRDLDGDGYTDILLQGQNNADWSAMYLFNDTGTPIFQTKWDSPDKNGKNWTVDNRSVLFGHFISVNHYSVLALPKVNGEGVHIDDIDPKTVSTLTVNGKTVSTTLTTDRTLTRTGDTYFTAAELDAINAFSTELGTYFDTHTKGFHHEALNALLWWLAKSPADESFTSTTAADIDVETADVEDDGTCAPSDPACVEGAPAWVGTTNNLKNYNKIFGKSEMCDKSNTAKFKVEHDVTPYEVSGLSTTADPNGCSGGDGHYHNRLYNYADLGPSQSSCRGYCGPGCKGTPIVFKDCADHDWCIYRHGDADWALYSRKHCEKEYKDAEGDFVVAALTWTRRCH